MDKFSKLSKIFLIISGFLTIAGLIVRFIMNAVTYEVGGIICGLLEILSAALFVIFAFILGFKEKPGFVLVIVALAAVIVNPFKFVTLAGPQIMADSTTRIMNEYGAAEFGARIELYNLVDFILSFFTGLASPLFFIGGGIKLVLSKLKSPEGNE